MAGPAQDAAALAPFRRDAEWLEPDGLGGFASGTAGGLRSRRYHALLLTARTPPTGRMVLINGCDAWLRIGAATYPLSSQLYTPDVVAPDARDHIESFTVDPWPRWTFNVGGARVDHEVFVPHGAAATAISWRLREPSPPQGVELVVRPFVSGRDYHGLHRENPTFRFEAEGRGPLRIFRPYPDVPACAVFSNGVFEREAVWYRSFLYTRERERGLDAVEDLASPGTWRWDLQRGEAIWILSAEGQELPAGSPAACLGIFRGAERRRRAAQGPPLQRAAAAYLARRGEGRTIVAGYPWFTDWGRDTFIAVRGLALATGRLDEAAAILAQWARALSQGMLPDRFPDTGAALEYNSVDASLWFVVAVDALLRAPGAAVGAADRQALLAAVEAILEGYQTGTRYGIRAADDGLLAAGEPGSQLTWMDARVDGRPVTPRCGKPVEVQALWIAALGIAAALPGAAAAERWRAQHEQALASFQERFWNEAAGCLFDVVDVDHRPGVVDAAMRPNQILAVGGLPVVLLAPDRARRVVDAVEARLWTPPGLRSLAPGEAGYAPRYQGEPSARDGAYHQGTVWPWLLGPFVEAWVRVRGGGEQVKQAARERFVAPVLARLGDYGIGHVPEIADGDPPHAPRGCPFQAWSLGELLRLTLDVLR